MTDILDYDFNTVLEPDYLCPSCKLRNVVFSLTELQHTKKYFILALEIFHQNIVDGLVVSEDKLKLTINSLPTTELQIDGSVNTLKSAIFHVGHTPHAGHYYAFAKFQKQWYKANNAKIDLATWPRGGKNVYICFYEKK